MNDRARVPFALIGVLLLVASTTLTATLAPATPPATEPAVERAIERTASLSQTVIRRSVQEAARDAARHPVVSRANSTVGRQLDPDRPFRDALRLRIYLAIKTRLDRLEERVGDVTVRARLPTPDETQIERTIARVTVATAGPNDTALAVRVRGIELLVHRDDHLVATQSIAPSLVVDTPVLAVHRRVRAFDRRLDRGPLSPGLGRRLTAQLYLIVWARGYAQHYGAPIANVLANRHVALATNRGLVTAQRTTLGQSDPDARRALAAAGRQVATRDLLAGATEAAGVTRARAILSAATEATTEPVMPPRRERHPDPNTPIQVGVNLTADRAFQAFVASAEGDTLSAVLAAVYGADVRLTSAVYRSGVDRHGDDPPAGWTVVDEDTRETRRVEPGPGPTPPAPGAWHRLRTYTRTVTVREETVRRWRRDNRTRTTRRVTTHTYRVGVGIVGRHARTAHVPPHPITTVHQRGAGPLNGPNLATIESSAVDRLVSGRGGADALARRAVAGSIDGESVRIAGRRPASLRAWIERDLSGLRRRVRNLTVAVPRGSLATYEVNPPAQLGRELSTRRDTLVPIPDRYGSVAAKARLAVRAAYLERVHAALQRRAAGRRLRERRMAGVLHARGVGSLGRLRQIRHARHNVTEEAPGPLRLAVDAHPPYLTLAALDRERFGTGSGAVHPLVARNLNVFTAPYGDAADRVTGGGTDSRSVDLRTAARTLRAARQVQDAVPSESRFDSRAALRAALQRSVDRVTDRLVTTLGRAGIGRSDRARTAMIATALDRWPTAEARALALANGSGGRAIVIVAARRGALSERRRDRLGVRVRLAVARSLRQESVRPAQAVVNGTAATTRRLARGAVNSAAAEVGAQAEIRVRRRALGRGMGSLPAGLPVAPVPGYWYATINVWHVTVRGRYERFVVRAPRGPPGATVAYVRDGRRVRLDVDGDGSAAVLGRADRVDLATETIVVVAVPPTGSGVGDTDGDADERSAGWPRPGPAE